MRTFNRIIKNGMGLLLATIALVLMFAVFTQDSFAAGTVTVKYDPNAAIGETTYNLYKVGTFGENGVFVFIDPFLGNITEVPNYKKDDFGGDEEAWKEKWMASAKTVSDYIEKEGIEPFDTKTVTAEQSKAGFQFDKELGNGFYIITGTTSEVEDGKGNITYYWPRPMYVRVLNDDTEYELKADHGYASRFTVVKKWDLDEEVKDLTRPEKITLQIFYDEELREEVTLPRKDEEGKEQWFYTWKTKMGEQDPNEWTVTEDLSDEKISSYYTVLNETEWQPDTDTWTQTITNTFEVQQLEIEKIMKDYIKHKDGSTQGFLFEVILYAGEKELPHRFTGLTFGEESDESDTTLVKNIPINVDKIVVKESYSGNYKPEGSIQKEATPPSGDSDTKKWTVSFTNVYNTDDTYDTGVINKYSITGDGTFSFSKKIGK